MRGWRPGITAPWGISRAMAPRSDETAAVPMRAPRTPLYWPRNTVAVNQAARWRATRAVTTTTSSCANARVPCTTGWSRRLAARCRRGRTWTADRSWSVTLRSARGSGGLGRTPCSSIPGQARSSFCRRCLLPLITTSRSRWTIHSLPTAAGAARAALTPARRRPSPARGSSMPRDVSAISQLSCAERFRRRFVQRWAGCCTGATCVRRCVRTTVNSRSLSQNSHSRHANRSRERTPGRWRCGCCHFHAPSTPPHSRDHR